MSACLHWQCGRIWCYDEDNLTKMSFARWNQYVSTLHLYEFCGQQRSAPLVAEDDVFGQEGSRRALTCCFYASVCYDQTLNDVMFLSHRKWKSPLLHGLSVLPALYDLLDDVRLHFLWVDPPPFFSGFPLMYVPLCPDMFDLHFTSDWRINCTTSYAKDGFWLYVTQIASCSPWMLWMFLNSVFHFMWVAVLIMCQLYQVGLHVSHAFFKRSEIKVPEFQVSKISVDFFL